jgi:peptide/nickel transport system substrate-binding protein
MSHMPGSPKRWTRRQFLVGAGALGVVAALPLLVACGAASEPTAVPAKPTEKPTAAPASGAPAPATVVPTSAPAAATVPAPTAAAVASPAPAKPAAIRDVPRNRTVVSTGWDLSGSNQIPNPTNFNPYAGVGFNIHQRNSLHYTINEMLFYTNVNDGKVIPWLGQSWQYNQDFTELTVKLRKEASWADGQPFTAKDIVFTLTTVKDQAPALIMSSQMKEWIKDAAATDDQTVKITLTKPGPRWASDFLAIGQAARLVWLPEHVFKGQDLKTFTFYDPAKGWPFGTGPFQVVQSDQNSMIFDRRDSWWAKDAGLSPLPEVQRVVVRPATDAALPQLYINNDVDVGNALTKGNFEAALAQNPNLASWNDKGPVWGGPDGCTYRVAFNVQKPPFDDPEIRWAFNYAIDRQQLVNLAYEGGTSPTVAPFSTYGGLQPYVVGLKDTFTKYKADTYDPKMTAEILTRKGYKKNSAGKWVKPDGSAWSLTLLVPAGDPQAPVLTEQLGSAGFDIVWKALVGNETTTGDFEIVRDQTCGSINDPWQTLRYFHGKYAVAPGQPTPEVRATTRYKNAELDSILDKMEAMPPSPDDATYMDLVRRATDILMRDMPSVYTAPELWVIIFNKTYWTGWPSTKDPYIAPYVPWEGFNQAIYRLKATK